MIINRFIDVHRIVPDAFHGTSLQNAESIVEGGQFKMGRGKDYFLGDGIYFYESSLENAKSWGKKKYDKILGVIQAKINLGRCLDLHDKSHSELIVETSIKLAKRTGKKLTDAFVINFIAQVADDSGNAIDTIRATYIAGGQQSRKKIFSGSRLFQEQQLMICVRNHASILNCWLCYSCDGGSDE